MSSKINILEIINGHFLTLRESNGKRSIPDFLTFILLPFALGFLSIALLFNLNDNLSSLLVNFGSIFIALLLSVLVLVYDQESKLEDRNKDKTKRDSLYDAKKDLLRQLYYNISYSILCAVALVLLCFVHSIVIGKTTLLTIGSFSFIMKYDIYLITPLVVFVTTNLFLNILMILKRMHALLISQ